MAGRREESRAGPGKYLVPDYQLPMSNHMIWRILEYFHTMPCV
jgi:hypothetical protein